MLEGRVKFIRAPHQGLFERGLGGVGLCPDGIVPTILGKLFYSFQSILA